MADRKKRTAPIAEPSFPTALFVTREVDTDGSTFLITHDDLNFVTDGHAVAIYNLTEEGIVNHPPAEFVSKG